MTHTERAKRYRTAADYIAALPPEKFNQENWFCGTAACVAGNICLMLGWRPSGPEGYVDKGDTKMEVESVANDFLGLDHPDRRNDGFTLFDPDAKWQTSAAAAVELLRRADVEDKLAAEAGETETK
jgi:hypothetical protein